MRDMRKMVDDISSYISRVDVGLSARINALEEQLLEMARRIEAVEKFILQGAENDWADKMDRIRNDDLQGVIKSIVREGFHVTSSVKLEEQ